MDKSLFFCGVNENEQNKNIISKMEKYSNDNSKQIYIINAPLGIENEDQYKYQFAIVILLPKHKISIINLDESCKDDDFTNFVEDFIEDLGYLSDKYDYKKVLGRPRSWKNKLINTYSIDDLNNMDDFINNIFIKDDSEQRNVDFLISLLTGSINDIGRIGGEYPETLLDQVKKKIILFDGEQSRFIYSKLVGKKRITIQGLAGTGKTELLLHKLKDLYIGSSNFKIVFTCFNKILAQSMKKRIPEFFNFMKVEEQIKWNDRLWVMHSWGSNSEKNSGLYSYICKMYGLDFHTYSYGWQFSKVCKLAVEELKNKENAIAPCFDYILIDESQDFDQSFFELCELVTSHTVYVAGDIFQDIYDRTLTQSVSSDYLLNKCYRTDPRTLMFAHAVGMGLYENPVIRWLEDNEWEACGYNIDRNKNFELSRAPLRRFEDIDISKTNSIKLYSIEKTEMEIYVYKIIDEIKKNNPTVQAGDIAVVFLEGEKENYVLADRLEDHIFAQYNWSVIKGYEVKDNTSDSLFISNRNNIKGLEFPFVICVISRLLSRDVFKRNTIYMMLTRSFITSYLLVNKENEEFISIYQEAAEGINRSGMMLLREPLEDEKQQQNQKLSIASTRKRAVKDVIDEIIYAYKNLPQPTINKIRITMMDIIKNEDLSELEIENRTKKLIEVFSGVDL